MYARYIVCKYFGVSTLVSTNRPSKQRSIKGNIFRNYELVTTSFHVFKRNDSIIETIPGAIQNILNQIKSVIRNSYHHMIVREGKNHDVLIYCKKKKILLALMQKNFASVVRNLSSN